MDEREQAQQLGATLAALRRSLNRKQHEMARKAGVAPSTYLRHELGRSAPSQKLLERYVRELGFTLEEFARIHQSLQLARDREGSGTAWWRKVTAAATDAEAREQFAKERFEQFAQLQADIYQLLFQRNRS